MLSLCSGIGGIDLAAEMAGMEIAGQVEIDPFCQTVLAMHWPNVKRLGDIREVRGDEFGPVDLVAGGIPCQPFSIAGKQAGAKDDRHLWPEMRRILGVAQPAWVLIENVAYFATLALDDVCADLEADDYETQAFVLPACAVEAPHRRERIFLVAYARRAGQSGRGDRVRGAPLGEISDDRAAVSGQSVANANDQRREWDEAARWETERRAEYAGVEDTDSGRRLREPSAPGWDERDGQAPGWLEGAGRPADAGPDVANPTRQRRGKGRPESAGQRGQVWPAGSSESRLADAAGPRLSLGRSAGDEAPASQSGAGLESEPERCRTLADAERERLSFWERPPGQRAHPTAPGNTAWDAESSLGGMPDGVPGGLDGYWPARPGEAQFEWEPPRIVQERLINRTKRIKALGNAVVPQQIFPILAAIVAQEQSYAEAQDKTGIEASHPTGSVC